ncbi:hypothetical protein [Chryseobacterium sp. GP-SGM7]|uniref:hypothetical protein n=1 Tax=Chryseobacterium sp. GP-SGM7 TaxID=3411323 RepID=UPI003B93A3E0
MKYILNCILVCLLINCKEKNKIYLNDIVGIIHQNNNIENNITNNYYVLDERFKDSGRHKLGLTAEEVIAIKRKIIEEDLYKLNDSLKFVKSYNISRLSKLSIIYKSGRKQSFIFENYNYRSNFNNESYDKIANVEELIAKIIMKKKIDPETVNIHF